MTRVRQRGAGLLMAVLLVVTVAAFAVLVAASQSGGDIQGSDANADGLQALFLAETGIERQLKRFATGTACASLGDDPATIPVEATHTIADLATIFLGNTAYTITLVNGLTTDFAGATLPATQCRVAATARVIANNVTRTIHAIVDRNLLEGPDVPPGPDNPSFNNPTTNVAPTGWTLNPANAYAFRGGHEGVAPNCGRSAWHVKVQSGAVESRAQLQSAPVAFSTVAASTTTITFHWRFIERTGGGCAAGGNTGPAWPAGCAAAAAEGQVCFRFTPAAAGGAVTFDRTATASVAVACPDPGTPTVFAPCSSQYQVEAPPTAPAPVAYPGKQSVTMVMGGGNITAFLMNIRLRTANRREIFIDHLEATNPTAIGAAHVKVWRDCSTAANPVTCV